MTCLVFFSQVTVPVDSNSNGYYRNILGVTHALTHCCHGAVVAGQLMIPLLPLSALVPSL